MKHTRFEENILVDESYTNYGRTDKNADEKKGQGIAKHFADTLEYDERKKWYHQLPEEPVATKRLTDEQIAELKKEASSALHGDTLAYETKSSRSGSSDQQWARTLMSKGTIGDRVAAATILIQDSPMHNLSALRNLIGSVKPAKKKDGIVVIDALSELLVSELLIPAAKLRKFEEHSLAHLEEMTSGNKQTRKTILKLWYYEDQLKDLYASYVDCLNQFAHDSVLANKEKSVSAMSYLLMMHPEKEKILLMNVINKLGDPSQTVASKVIYHLCQLLLNHPNMKAVVLGEIEKMLFRTNISTRAQYYGVCFLNQFFLGKDDAKIAESLIKIYFSFFKASIKKGDIDSRLMSAILTGVKRAYPFADSERIAETSQHIDAVHRIVHLGRFNIAIHALALLFQISDASKGTADRYYTSLYRKLTNAEIFNTSHTALLFSLIYKSLKQDKNVSRVASFIKRLLQISCLMTPAQACGILYLVSQVTSDPAKRDCVKLVWTKQELKDEIEEKTEADPEDKGKETESEDKSEPTEENTQKDETKKMNLLAGTKQDLLNDDDEDETYQDLKIDSEGNIRPKKRKKVNSKAPGWFHVNVKTEESAEEAKVNVNAVDSKKMVRQLEAKIQLKKSINMDRTITGYDPNVRNPAFSGAEQTAFVELLPLAKHFHPTVKLYAEKIIKGLVITYSGDPLKDFSGMRFLDRFVFKNPKKRTDQETGEGEVKKVRGSHPRFALRKNYTAKGMKSLAVNSASYLNEDVKKVPVDELFLYDYLQKKRAVVDSDEEQDSDNDSVTSEDFEKYLDQVTGAAAGGEASDEEDVDFLSELQDTMQKRGDRKKTKGEEEEQSGEEMGSDDQDDDESDGDLNISGDDEEASGLSGDEDELLLEDSSSDNELDLSDKKSSKKNKLKPLKGKDNMGSLFASAEEFSTLLEETASTKKQGSSQAVANTDNADVKQLAWEDKRDHWVKGFNRKVLGAKPGQRNKGRSFGGKGGDRKFEKGNLKNKFDRKSGGKRKPERAGGAGGKKKKFN